MISLYHRPFQKSSKKIAQISGFLLPNIYAICLLTKLRGGGIIENSGRKDSARPAKIETKKRANYLALSLKHQLNNYHRNPNHKGQTPGECNEYPGELKDKQQKPKQARSNKEIRH
jgi:hypothetical protein